MRFLEAELPGAYLIELEPIADERGFFARTWCRREFETHGLAPSLAQCNLSFNRQRGIVRGMHLQTPPCAEAKLVRCTVGAVFDVIVDLRSDSPTYLRWFGVELSADNRSALYIPEGMAHGFQTLEDNTEVFYQMSSFYSPEHSLGYRYDDPAFGVRWPLPITLVGERDRQWAPFQAMDRQAGP